MAQKKTFQELNLNNSFLFAAAMEDEEICRMVLEVILRRSIAHVKVHAEHSILYNSDYRSVRLDVYAKEGLQVDYDVEMQNENLGDLAKRSRLYQAERDVSALLPGQEFDELRTGYVIFICTFDPFGKGLYQYTFEERCVESDFSLEDGAYRIFLNTKGKNTEEVPAVLVHFLRYVEQSTETCVEESQDEVIGKLHDRILRLKASRDMEARYMRLEELIRRREKQSREEGIEEGKEEGKGCILELIQRMTEDGMADKIPQLTSDPDYCKEMLKHYQI